MIDKNKLWNYSKPDFDFLPECQDFTWFGHTPFAYDLVSNLNPKSIVELGTYKGTSLSAFAQGVKDHKLSTQIFAVDAWQGDENTGFYNSDDFTLDLYSYVKNRCQKLYGEQKIKLMRMYFSEALDTFIDGTIDVLHIDGLHTYEAVKADYNAWKIKVRDDGVILFHDIFVEDFGVKEVWADVKHENPDAFFLEFPHHFGLGVMFKSETAAAMFKDKSVSDIYNHYAELANSYVSSMDILRVQGERDRLYYDLQWWQQKERDAGSKYELAVRLNDSNIQELNTLYTLKGEFYSKYYEFHPSIDEGLDRAPKELQILEEWQKYRLELAELEKNLCHFNKIAEELNQTRGEVIELRSIANRKVVKVFNKLDKSAVMQNQFLRRIFRVTLRTLVKLKRIILEQ